MLSSLCCYIIATCLCLLQACAASSPTVAILLDIDNTIYNEADSGIEAQIVKNTHSYCKAKFGMDNSEADDLFRQFGSTVEGLKQITWKKYTETEVQRELDEFYAKVYSNIDYSSLVLKPSTLHSSTGYSMIRDRKLLHQLLRFCPYPICVASNSPSWHVRRTLEAMGLGSIPFHMTITPDRFPLYPTKHDPKSFFEGACEELLSYGRLIAFDDSKLSLSSVCDYFPNAEPVAISSEHPLTTALLRTGLLDPAFVFDQVKYLESKNCVDRKSMNSDIWNEVISNLQKLGIREVQIADVGAGILSMLDLFLHGDVTEGLKPLIGRSKEAFYLQYTAYESNAELYAACHQKLLSWGFSVKEKTGDNTTIYEGPSARVRLVLQDFDSLDPISAPDLIVGCCFADLFDPSKLVQSLVRSFSLLESQNTFLYFPITFGGITQLYPPQPHELNRDSKIPSDTTALRLYSNALHTELGHNLDTRSLQDEMERHGLTLRKKGTSNWIIDHASNPYLYLCMLYFFGSAGGPRIQERGWDARGWIKRIYKCRPQIQVANVDLMFHIGRNTKLCHNCVESDNSMEEICFFGPRNIGTRKQAIPDLLPSQVLSKSLEVAGRSKWSSRQFFSSGTELKIFNGHIEDAALDSTIEDMKGERMAYSLSYGYSLVGHIVQCGNAVPSDLIGKLVFSFSPHGSHLVTDVGNIHIVPDSISPQDAIFMPSVETALSLIHDANPRLGENVAVFGQGLIGLLVTAILGIHRQTSNSAKFGVITVFDTIPERLMVAARFGATQALLPGGSVGPFDVSIEVSGNSKALQSAIDLTVDGGRIIVGSWYGNSAVDLNLGIEFHRSQKTIRASQVSKIPSELQRIWNKDRRFEYTWELVKRLRPSRLISRTSSIKDAQDAYEALEVGQEIAIAFKY